LSTLAIFFSVATVLFAWFYFLSIPAHRETGRAFRAVVDMSAPSVKEWLKSAPTQLDQEASAQSTKVRRFLRSLLEPDQ
jgi:hypothetical protein